MVADRARRIGVGLQRLAAVIAELLVTVMRVEQLNIGPQLDGVRAAFARFALDQMAKKAAQPVAAHAACHIKLLKFDDTWLATRLYRDRSDDFAIGLDHPEPPVAIRIGARGPQQFGHISRRYQVLAGVLTPNSG